MDSILNQSKGGSIWQVLTPLPLSVLAWLELQALKMEYTPLVKQSATWDSWFVSRDGETEGPEKLKDVLHRLINGQSSIALLHESAAEEESPRWHFVSYRSWCLNPVTSTLWIVSVWALAALFGWVFICMILPFPVRGLGQWAYGLGLLAFAGATFSPKFRLKLARWQKPKQRAEESGDGEPLEIGKSISDEEQ